MRAAAVGTVESGSLGSTLEKFHQASDGRPRVAAVWLVENKSWISNDITPEPRRSGVVRAQIFLDLSEQTNDINPIGRVIWSGRLIV